MKENVEINQGVITNLVTGKTLRSLQFALRLSQPEQVRYEELIRRVWQRNPLADGANINRELLGLKDYGLLTQEDIAYFRGQAEVPVLEANVPKSSSQRRLQEAESNAPVSKKRKAK
jgi:hypothetical protein